MAARRYEISPLMLKQYFTASSKAYPSFSVGLLVIIPLLRKAWTNKLELICVFHVKSCMPNPILHPTGNMLDICMQFQYVKDLVQGIFQKGSTWLRARAQRNYKYSIIVPKPFNAGL